jgi:putative DNA primase/helicase
MSSRGLLQSWARALGGEASGANVACPGPGHSPRDRSLSVTPSGAAPNGFLVNSFGGNDPIGCLDYVRAKLAMPVFTPTQPRARPAGSPQQGPPVTPAAAALAMSLWHAATNPRGTLVERYLKSRRLDLPDEAAGEAIRFHASCSFGPEQRWFASCGTSSPMSRKAFIGPRFRATGPRSNVTKRPTG